MLACYRRLFHSSRSRQFVESFSPFRRILRKQALLFTSIEVPHRNHTYDVPIVIQNDQIWQIAFAHDFSDLIHSLSLEAVAINYLHYTVNIRLLAEIRGETASAGVG